MKLTQLEIQGFKSFADRIRLQFDSGITGIVGPNGCGKSNVIDAIRWVLGEQKTRNLRSDKMENVIFNGTAKRKRANLAEVTMTLENDRGVLPTEYRTVNITRRLYRDGESEYLLNGVPCRLKDITTLLLDTGIGADSYAIIELSAVEELLTDKNNSRRQLFEEAAGISKYKLRKRETLSRLDETQQSLVRVEDLLAEIEKQLRSLERQARRAEQYLEIKTAYRRTSAQFAILKLESFRGVFGDIEAEERRLADELSAVQGRIAQTDARVQELQAEALRREAEASAARQRLSAHLDTIQKAENDHALRSDRLKYLLQREGGIQQQLGGEGDQRAAFEAKLAALEGQIDAANETYDKQEYLLVELEKELEDLRAAVQHKTRLVDELTGQVRGRDQHLQATLREQERRSIQLQGLRSELARTLSESSARTEQVEDYAGKMARLTADAQGMEAEAARLAAARDEHAAQLHALTDTLTQLREDRFQRQRLLDMRQQEYTMTKGLVESLEGFSESVKFLKKNAQWAQQATLLSEAFYCPEPCKLAVEAVLEPYLNWYVVATRAEAAAGLRLLKDASRGRANFFILDEIAAWLREQPVSPLEQPQGQHLAQAGGATRLADVVECTEALRPLAQYLLGNAWLVDALPAEAAVLPHTTFVERSGAVLARPGMLAGGSIGLFEGQRIGRAKNLEKLGPEIKSLQDELAERSAELQAHEARLAALQAQNPAAALEAHTRELQRVQRELSILQAKDDEYQNYLSRMRARGGDIEAEIARLEAEHTAAQPRLEQLQDEHAGLAADLARHQTELGTRSQQLAERSQRHHQENIRFLEAKNAVAALKKDFLYTREQLQGLDTQREQLTAELAQVRHDAEALSTQGSDYNARILELYEQRRDLQEAVQALEERVAAIRNTVLQHENDLRDARRQREDVHARHTALKDRSTEIRIQQNSMAERMQVEFQLDLAQLRDDEVFDQPKADYHLPDVEAAMLRLREQLQRFGEVNPTAIEAYNEVKERYDFITAQRDDLNQARANLLDTMREMDATALEKFTAAFGAIRDNFQRVFRSLFTDEDTCDISLVRPDDPLESPIEIMARPKGKRPLTINQLSGGEKTLTAISLLFAIYLIKPAPFCIFDEVDAPLDDANVDKFTNIIRDFSAGSQFVIVTHNKRTMAKTNVMYGVTMEETGVSRVLPVDLVALRLN